MVFAALVGVAQIGSVTEFNNTTMPDEVLDMINSQPEPEPEPVDVIESAKSDLERINQELDAEETSLVADRAQLVANYEAAVAALTAEHEAAVGEIDTRLESIRETRTSF